jgi:hypothetical protein
MGSIVGTRRSSTCSTALVGLAPGSITGTLEGAMLGIGLEATVVNATIGAVGGGGGTAGTLSRIIGFLQGIELDNALIGSAGAAPGGTSIRSGAAIGSTSRKMP